MSMNNEMDEYEAPQEVVDEEGDVDKALKKRIIQARERVDETELALYRDATMDPEVDLSLYEKIHIYAMTVKQFIRRIEPLLRTENIEGNERYWKGVDIAEIELAPPDTEGYRFSLLTQSDRDEHELRQMLNLPRTIDLPTPVTVTFQGLETIIERDPVLSYRWEVCVSREGAPPNWEYVYPEVQRPVPKKVYEDATRKATMFLQQAGIAVETDTKGTDIIRNFDSSGEEVEAEYGTGDYDANPGL
ncbi:MAG: hypothetical protein ABEI52_07915 [Halobacteriaceae archaeon]